jgi:hypothetical protein
MSLDIIYSCGNREHRFRVTSTEFEALAKFAAKNCKKAFGIVFGQPDFDHSVRVKVVALATVVKTITQAVKNSREALGYVYTTKGEYPRGSGLMDGGSGIMGGVKIDGEEFSLETGCDVCTLTKYWYDDNGKPHRGEPQDVRHLTLIKTDSDSLAGDVTIKKRKAGGAVLKKLAELEGFLATCGGKSVTIHME